MTILTLQNIKKFKVPATYLKKMPAMKTQIGKLVITVGERFRSSYEDKLVTFMPVFIDPSDPNSTVTLVIIDKTFASFFAVGDLSNFFKKQKVGTFTLGPIKKITKAPSASFKKDLVNLITQIQLMKNVDVNKATKALIMTRSARIVEPSFKVITGKIDPEWVLRVAENANAAYHKGTSQSKFTDDQYDDLKELAKRLNPKKGLVLEETGAPAARGKVTLPVPMGSLEKIKPDGSATKKFMAKVQDVKYVLSDKLDGLSFQLIYESGVLVGANTRGNGKIGQNVLRHVLHIPAVPKTIPSKYKGKYVIRAEALLTNSDFVELRKTCKDGKGKDFSNPRNMMAGIINRTKPEEAVFAKMQLGAYSIQSHESTMDKDQQLITLKQMGFKPVNYKVLTPKQVTEENLVKYTNSRKKAVTYDMDGLVLEANSAKIRQRIGLETNSIKPAYARAFKTGETDQVEVEVNHIQWRGSKDHLIIPRIKINPVTLGGVTVDHTAGFNAAFIVKNKIGPGTKLLITRSGDVIPHILKVIKSTKAQLPDKEEFGSYDWNETKVHFVMKDKDNVRSKLKQLERFFVKTGIEDLKMTTLQKIVDAGYTDLESIVLMTVKDFMKVEGIQAKSAEKLHNNIAKALSNIPLPRLASATMFFGRNFGERRLEALYAKFGADMFKWEGLTKGQVIKKIEKTRGFSEDTARQFVEGIKPFNAFLKKIRKKVTIAEPEKPKSSKLAGKSFCFTGYRDKGAEAVIKANGGTVVNTAGKGLTYLVAADPDSNSLKLQKARDLGIKVIGDTELKKVLKGLST